MLLMAAAVAALGLSACGRTGPLELPPGPAAQPPAAAEPPASPSFFPSASAAPATPPPENAAAYKNGFDAAGNPVAGPGQKRPFVLDPLLQ
jgi:predicted small lipoprotein YifL